MLGHLGGWCHLHLEVVKNGRLVPITIISIAIAVLPFTPPPLFFLNLQYTGLVVVASDRNVWMQM